MLDIDMETYGRGNAPAAMEQPVDTSFEHQEEGNALSIPEPMVNTASEAVTKEPEKPVNPQSEHFRALRDEVDRMKAEREAEKRDYQIQLEMLRANLGNQKQPQEPSSKRMFDGLSDEDVPSVAEIRREWEQREAGYQARLEELQVQQAYPDYAEVIEKFSVPLMKQKPHLLQGLQSSSNKAMYAYDLGKMVQQMVTMQTTAQQRQAEAPKAADATPMAPDALRSEALQKAEAAQRMVENSRKPGTLSQGGGQSALSQADYFATMSDAEFMKFATGNLGEI